MTFEELLGQALVLPADQQKKLIHELVEVLAKPAPQPVKERVFGLTKGTFTMSDDFDDELPDEFWLGDDT